MPPRKPKEQLRPGAMSPDAYEETLSERDSEAIADRVWRGNHGYSPARKSVIRWSDG